jgi:hypothetical protein
MKSINEIGWTYVFNIMDLESLVVSDVLDFDNDCQGISQLCFIIFIVDYLMVSFLIEEMSFSSMWIAPVSKP